VTPSRADAVTPIVARLAVVLTKTFAYLHSDIQCDAGVDFLKSISSAIYGQNRILAFHILQFLLPKNILL
jgi:hypothetical protein